MKNNDSYEALFALSLSIGKSVNPKAMLQKFLNSLSDQLSAPAVILAYRESLWVGSREQIISSECHSSRVGGEEFLPNNVIDDNYPQWSLGELGKLILLADVRSWKDAFRFAFEKVLERLILSWEVRLKKVVIKNNTLQLGLSAQAGEIGIWNWGVDSPHLNISGYSQRILGLDPECTSLSVEDFTAAIHSEDVDTFRRLIGSYISVKTNEKLETGFRFVRPDGQLRKLSWHALQVDDDEGIPDVLVGVIMDITDIEIARSETLYRSQLEQIMIQLLMRLINAPLKSIDKVITDSLGEVGHFLGVDRAYRFDYDWISMQCSNTHEWCEDGVDPQIEELQNISIAQINLWVESHREGLVFMLSSLDSLGDDNPLRSILEPQGIKSVITVPLMGSDGCSGFIGFDAVRNKLQWTDIDVSLLKLLAELIVNAENRRAHDLKLIATLNDLKKSRDAALTFADAAREASSAKSRFVATVSHEIRTPLHVIGGMTELLGMALKHGELEPYVEAIEKASRDLRILIDDILDFSRMESAQLCLSFKDFDLYAMVEAAGQEALHAAPHDGVEFQLTWCEHAPRYVVSDEFRIKQIIINLLSNAFKFTRHGSVAINVTADTTSLKSKQVIFRIIVSDTGIGIDPAKFDSIFEPFFQVNDTGNTGHKGTGLGLSIVNLLVGLLGGSIHLSSEPGKGSRFVVVLPLQTSRISHAVREHTESPYPVTVERETAGTRLLIAEDNQLSRLLMAAHLNTLQCEIKFVVNGYDAVCAFEDAPFDMVFMDCRMPRMDGFEATRLIRNLGSKGASVPIVAITANALSDDREACFAAGMSDFLAKPFTRGELHEILDKWLERVRMIQATSS